MCRLVLTVSSRSSVYPGSRWGQWITRRSSSITDRDGIGRNILCNDSFPFCTNMDIGLTDPCISLTIKAPNQQIDDQIIKCKLDWSVAKLKGYIQETYPNKPVSVWRVRPNYLPKTTSVDVCKLSSVLSNITITYLLENRGPKIDILWTTVDWQCHPERRS